MKHFFILLLLLIPAVNGLNATVAKYVEDAISEALDEISKEAKTEVTSTGQVDSQVANVASKKLQFSADVFQHVTIILVKKYGVEILEQANEVFDLWIETAEKEPEFESREDSTDEDNKRSKRYANEPVTACKIRPRPCNDGFNKQWRQASGICNNIGKPTLGQSVTVTKKLLGTASYSDGIQKIMTTSVTGAPLPSTRAISNALFDTGATTIFDKNINHFHMAYGQFVAHDTVFLPSSTAINGEALNCSSCNAGQQSANCDPMPVPANDKYFPPNSCIRFTRALNGQLRLGVRQQVNQNSHYLDGSTIYGSDECEERALRTFSRGLLTTYTGMGYTLPPQDVTDPNCLSGTKYCFKAGDFRNTLQPGLPPTHTLFIKGHNSIATQIGNANRALNDEQIYQMTKRIIIALHQHFTYNEYLPKILSDKYMKQFDLYPMPAGSGPYRGYSNSIDPTVTVEYAISAFRFGHSQSRNDFPRRRAANSSANLGTVTLGDNMFYADAAYDTAGGHTETVLMGMLTTASEASDRYTAHALRNQMFEIRGKKASGVDLAALDVMRARDAGTWPYYKYRSLVGLPEINTWTDLNSQFTSANIAALKTIYAHVKDIDLYTAILMENPVSGGLIGPTGSYMIAEQFSRLKKADRFYYENMVPGTQPFTAEQLDSIRQTSFAKFICDNTAIATTVNRDAFDVHSPQVACSSLKPLNIQLFVNPPRNSVFSQVPIGSEHISLLTSMIKDALKRSDTRRRRSQ